MNDTIGPSLPGPSTTPPPRTAKIVLIGSASTGKTSIRNRFFRGTNNSKAFSQAYIATIGADFVTKKVEFEDDGSCVNVQLWDTAGQERFQALGAAFYRGADACILVYSIDSRPSFKKLENWYHSFVDRCPVPSSSSSSTPVSENEREEYEKRERRLFPFICLGNKSDLSTTTHTGQQQGAGDLVKEKEVTDLLDMLCPVKKLREEVESRQKGKGKQIDDHGREVEIAGTEASSSSAPLGAKTAQKTTNATTTTTSYKYHSRTTSKSYSKKRRHSSQSSIQIRSISVLPDKPKKTSSSSNDNEEDLDAATAAEGRDTLDVMKESKMPRSTSIYHTPASSMAGTSHYATGTTTGHKRTDDPNTSVSNEDGERTLREEDEIPTDVESPDLYEDNEPPVPGGSSLKAGMATDSLFVNSDEADEEEVAKQEEAEEELFGSLDGIKHFYTSAKTGEGIEEAFTYLIKRLNELWKYQDSIYNGLSRNDGAYGDASWNGGVDYGLKPRNVNNGGKNDSVKIGDKEGSAQERKGWRASCC